MPTGEVLFSKSGKGGASTADEWDDTELLREYDRAVRPVRALVAERMGLSLEDMTSASESCSSSKSISGDKALPNHKKGSKKKKSKKGQHVEWMVGDHCQAMYSVDGNMYEATIMSLDHRAGTCCVQFVGYGNEEELSTGSLKRSMGSAIRRNQRQAASANEVVENTENSIHPSQWEAPQGNEREDKHASENMKRPSPKSQQMRPPHFPGSFGLAGPSMPRGLFDDMIPPPPPPHVLSHLPVEESDALSAMLMSWYMSGFHTGYYQGLKRAKSRSSS